MIKYKDNSSKYIKELKKTPGNLARVSAETVNTGAKVVHKHYKKEINKFERKVKFTMNAPRILFSKPQKSSGGFRDIGAINAIVYVPKMKGGKEHYLNKSEKGDVKTGGSNTMGKVAKPTTMARTGKNDKRPISKPLRLQSSRIQTLKVGNRKIGFEGDGFNAKNGAQRWAILYKYTGRSGSGRGNTSRGQEHNVGRYGWDLAKQFFFTGMNRGLGVFKLFGKRIHMTRQLDSSTQKIKATHKFEKSIEKLKPNMMKNIFNLKANKILKK